MRVMTRWRSRDIRRTLSALPPFARCSAAELRRIARRGEVIEVDAGTVLLREGSPDYWFYVVVSGSVALSHGPALARGAHVGEIGILAWGLQPAAAVATERSLLFVLGRRDFITFVHSVRAFQEAVFPEARGGGFDALRRRLFDEGRIAWDSLSPHTQSLGPVPDSLRSLRLPGRSVRASSLTALAANALRLSAPAAHSAEAPRRLISARARLAVALAVAAILVLSALTYHPPLAVVRAGAPIDVAADITVAGRPVEKPSGEYLLVSVRFARPNVIGLLMAKASSAQIVRVRPSLEDTSGTGAFEQSERLAVEAAAAAVGLDPAKLSVTFRPRDLSGPSAGLVYALALADMLDADDIAGGRVIAATGELDSEGRVLPVGFIGAKSSVVWAGRARVFLVPIGQESQASASRADVRGVATVADALRALRRR